MINVIQRYSQPLMHAAAVIGIAGITYLNPRIGFSLACAYGTAIAANSILNRLPPWKDPAPVLVPVAPPPLPHVPVVVDAAAAHAPVVGDAAAADDLGVNDHKALGNGNLDDDDAYLDQLGQAGPPGAPGVLGVNDEDSSDSDVHEVVGDGGSDDESENNQGEGISSLKGQINAPVAQQLPAGIELGNEEQDDLPKAAVNGQGGFAPLADDFNGILSQQEVADQIALFQSLAGQAKLRRIDDDVKQAPLGDALIAEEDEATDGECTLIGSEIPSGLRIDIGVNPFDIRYFVQGILTQGKIQDPYTRNPFVGDQLDLICDFMGIGAGEFRQIWANAEEQLNREFQKKEREAHQKLEAENASIIDQMTIAQAQGNFARYNELSDQMVGQAVQATQFADERGPRLTAIRIELFGKMLAMLKNHPDHARMVAKFGEVIKIPNPEDI